MVHWHLYSYSIDAYIDCWEDYAEKAKKYARLSSTVILVTVSSSLLGKLEQREKIYIIIEVIFDWFGRVDIWCLYNENPTLLLLDIIDWLMNLSSSIKFGWIVNPTLTKTYICH